MRLKGLYIILLVFCFAKFSFGQTTIAVHDFETILGTPTLAISSGTPTYVSGSSVAGDRPATSPFYVSTNRAWGESNATRTITFSNQSLTGYTNCYVEFRLASFSIGSTANGADAGDIVTTEISVDGGTNFYSTVRVLGNSNAYWAYNATGNATTTYDGDITPVDYSPAGGGSRTTDGYCTVRVDIPVSETQVMVRITLLNNSTNEKWCIDDLKILGTTTCTPPTIQASGASLSGITNSQMTVNWTGNGDGDAGVIVIARASLPVSSAPASGTTYTANSIFGSGTSLGASNYVVYIGTGSNVTVTGLSGQTKYYFAVYTYNTAGPCYLTASPALINNLTLSNPPASHAGSFVATPSNCTDISLTWTAASFPLVGANVKGYMILMRSDLTNPDATGVANAVAPASLILPAGTTLAGTSTSTSYTVTGLSALTTYNFAIIPYCWDATNAVTYDYYTAPTIPTANAITTTTTSTYYYRSKVTGNWNSTSTWEASPTGLGGWINACSVPSITASAVQIQSGHTVTINTNATAPNLTIDGILIFDNTARTVTITDYVTISSTGIFITQALGSATHGLTIGGNLTNSGIFDMSRAGTTLVCNVTFNKNGNQNISGAGGTTRFYYIKVNLGTSRANILDISTSNFNAPAFFLHSAAAASPNDLLNGTIKISGTYNFNGTLLQTGANYKIPATAGVWLNNPNFTINAQNDSYDILGLLKITNGTFNAGTAIGNSIRLLSGSQMVVQGGVVNVAGRIQAANIGGTAQNTLSYNQSGGTVTLTTAGSNTSGTIADFHFASLTDTLNMSGGTLVFRNVATVGSDIFHYGVSNITGGTFQFADASTLVNALQFEIECGSAIPSIYLFKPAATNTYLYLGEHLIVKGNITISSGTTFDNYWDSTFQYNISLSGNWNNSGTFLHNNSKTITFNGTSAQSINGTSTTGFNNLTINNSLGGVTLNTPVILNGTTAALTLTNGFLFTSATNILTMNAGTTTSGANNASFVYGPMSKIGSTPFTFPVGKDLQYRSIAISALTGSETFTAEYFHADPDLVPYDVTLKDATLDDIGRCEYWILNRAGSVNATVTLSWNTYSCGVTSLPDLAVARWDGAMWKDEGNTATTGFPDPGIGTVSSGTVTSFSPFTLASRTSGVNPLPIELLSFTANYNSSNQVDVKWSTASETNNDYFTVERSADAVLFNELNVTDGAGNSNAVLNYSTTDDSPLSGISYYRLKQTDFNGSYKYSSTVSVQKTGNDFDISNAYYSAAENTFAIYFNCTSNCIITIELYDLNGRKVYSSIENTLGKNSEIVIPAANFSEGIYLIKAYNGNKLVSKKIKL